MKTYERAVALAESITQRFSQKDDLNCNPLEGWDSIEARLSLDYTYPATEDEVEAHTVVIQSTSLRIDRKTIHILKTY